MATKQKIINSDAWLCPNCNKSWIKRKPHCGRCSHCGI